MKRICLALACLASFPAFAHHGVAGVGAAALEGPGAPIESSSSATLPEGKTLAYFKLDHAQFKTFDPGNPEAKYSQFWMMGAGYGFTPWLSAYLFAPYNRKIDEPGGFDTQGWADVSWMGQVGFKYDRGFRLIPANESLDDLEDWHFTLFGGGTLPSGNANRRDPFGAIDPGKSTGFGKPSYSLGLSSARMLSPRLTFNMEASMLRFREYAYADGNHLQFGSEDRLNGSLAYRMVTDAERKLRIDGVIEAQYLALGRDRSNGSGEIATGGRLLYLMPGVRIYQDNMSFALGFKKAAWTQLNESDQQQGSEGKEKYRVMFSASALF